MNAAQALPEGHRDHNEIRAVTTPDGAGRAVVEIRDTGAGIPASAMARIFDPFFTTKAVGVGTGLGLSICHTIVTAMGGEISAASEPGRGTTIRVVLPAASHQRIHVAAPPVDGPHTSRRAVVLVVDDEPAVGIAMGRVLRHHEVTVASTAKKALELLDAGKRFDVIFCDLMMPEMSGMDFYDELTLRFPGVARRVIFVSGGAFTARASVSRPGDQRRIDKPFDPHTVRTLVQRYLAGDAKS
jgi:CheY-like chemotaxis protein